MEKKLTKFEFFSLSILLFGMFFGAGNLIFPPILGYKAGDKTLISFLFFSLTAIIFPILAIVAVAKSDGMQKLASRVNPKFALLYTIAIYISIGPGLALPRSGAVPFEMTIFQYLPEGVDVNISRLIYTFVFFAVSYFVALSPSKLVDRSGKVLTPLLLLLVFLLLVGIVVKNPAQIAPAKTEYASSPAIVGFLEGYNTLDAIAGLNFGLVIAYTLRNYSIKEKSKVVKYTLKSGLIAGTVLFIVYSILSYIGMNVSGVSENLENGAQVITYLSKYVFGDFGVALVILLFTLACLTTAIGLVVSISEYFASIFTFLGQKGWTLVIVIISFVLSNFGLNTILQFSVPILYTLYPFSLVLIIMGVLHDKVKFTKASYVSVAVVTFFIAVVTTLSQHELNIPLVTNLVNSLPLAEESMNWVLPTLVVLVATQVLTYKKEE